MDFRIVFEQVEKYRSEIPEWAFEFDADKYEYISDRVQELFEKFMDDFMEPINEVEDQENK